MLILDLKNASLRPLVSQEVPSHKFKQDVKRRLLPRLCFFEYNAKEKWEKKKKRGDVIKWLMPWHAPTSAVEE